jgi:2-haloacid dehalogenase
MIEFVLLDLDDTILDFHKAEDLALRDTLRTFGVEPTDELVALYSKINEAQWKLLEQGLLTRPEVKLRRFVLFFERLGVQADAEAARTYYEKRLGVGHIFLPGGYEMLERLFGKYRLFIVSNGTTAVQIPRLASAGIGRFFEKIFLSEEVGCVKPEKLFFDRCIEQIDGFDPTRAIILGDSLTSDVQGGINAGIRTCWFNPHGKTGDGAILPDFEVRTHEEFEALLERI